MRTLSGEALRKYVDSQDMPWDSRSRKLCADISKARKLIGFEPEMPFEEGIKETLDWYMNNGLI